MTQPAPVPSVRSSEEAHGARRRVGKGRSGSARPGSARPGSARPGSARPGKGWAWAAGIIGAGIPAGFLWWLLAPGGQNLISGNPALSSGTNTEGWLPRDLVLAGLFVFAGCLV